MKYSDIKFTEHGGRYGSSKGLRIGGYWVTKDLVDLMWLRAPQVLPNLDWSKPQTVVTIFGDLDDWRARKPGPRIALGRCLKYFADNNMLPIRVVNAGKGGTRKYVRK